VAVVPGIDGRKMSKSYDNTIGIFEPEGSIKKKVMRMVTDSTPVEQPKDPDKCNIFALLKLVADENEIKEWDEKYRKGGVGYGDAKKRLVELLIEYFKPYRAKRQELESNIDYVREVLKNGADRARPVAHKTFEEVRKAVGL
jgi:tryptophanyl-tRNA synthetase